MRRISASLVTVAAIVALAGCVIPAPPEGGDANGPTTAGQLPANMASHGVVATDAGVARTGPLAEQPVPVDAAVLGDRVHVIVYLDFGCLPCRMFEEANGAYLEEAVASGEVALEIRPVAFVGEYSTHAVAVLAAVADLDPDRAVAVAAALVEQQPAEGGAGPGSVELLAIAEAAGASSPELDDAVTSGRFLAIADILTASATEAGVVGVPFVTVDGVAVPYAMGDDDAALRAAVEAASSP